MAVNGIPFTLPVEPALTADIVAATGDVRFRQLAIGRGIVPPGGLPSTRRRSWAGQRDALHAHRRGVRRCRGRADRAGAGGGACPGRTSPGPPSWLGQSPGRPSRACGPYRPAPVPDWATARTRGTSVLHCCCRAFCAARTRSKGCKASSGGARAGSEPRNSQLWSAGDLSRRRDELGLHGRAGDCLCRSGRPSSSSAGSSSPAGFPSPAGRAVSPVMSAS